jgi:hypothetical protein
VSLDAMFTLELLLLALVIVVILGGFVYLATRRRRMRRETGREVGTADVPTGTVPEELAENTVEGTPRRERPRRVFYKSMGLETSEEMKIRLYSLEDYESELGGEAEALNSGGFLAALKAYRLLDDEWYDYAPEKAAEVLELAPEDYEVDEERLALLLRKLPPGLPTSARDAM